MLVGVFYDMPNKISVDTVMLNFSEDLNEVASCLSLCVELYDFFINYKGEIITASNNIYCHFQRQAQHLPLNLTRFYSNKLPIRMHLRVFHSCILYTIIYTKNMLYIILFTCSSRE